MVVLASVIAAIIVYRRKRSDEGAGGPPAVGPVQSGARQQSFSPHVDSNIGAAGNSMVPPTLPADQAFILTNMGFNDRGGMQATAAAGLPFQPMQHPGNSNSDPSLPPQNSATPSLLFSDPFASWDSRPQQSAPSVSGSGRSGRSSQYMDLSTWEVQFKDLQIVKPSASVFASPCERTGEVTRKGDTNLTPTLTCIQPSLAQGSATSLFALASSSCILSSTHAHTHYQPTHQPATTQACCPCCHSNTVGGGSFGKVFLAHFKQTPVAVKVLVEIGGKDASVDPLVSSMPMQDNPILKKLHMVGCVGWARGGWGGDAYAGDLLAGDTV